MTTKSRLQVTASADRDEGVQQYRALLDPTLLDQPLPKAPKPTTYSEEVQGSSPHGDLLFIA